MFLAWESGMACLTIVSRWADATHSPGRASSERESQDVVRRRCPTTTRALIPGCRRATGTLKEGTMSVLQRWSAWKEEPRRTAVILGSLLLTFALGTRAHAVTAVSIDGHSNPVSLVEGETVMVRFDVAKPGGSVKGTLARDLTGT